MSGVYYIASQHSECSPWYVLNGKIKRLVQAFIYKWNNSNYAIRAGDASKLILKDDSVDYIFIDPPFGDNLAYAELNFVLESFHRAFTNIQSEAIVSSYQKKNIGTYYKSKTISFLKENAIIYVEKNDETQSSNTGTTITFMKPWDEKAVNIFGSSSQSMGIKFREN